MTRLIRIVLSIPLGLSGFAIFATAFSHFMNKGRGDDETLITLVVMGFFAIGLARFIYPGKPEPEQPAGNYDHIPDDTHWTDDDDWMRDDPAPAAKVPASVPAVPAARNEGISSSHTKILEALGTSHAQRKAAKTYENVDQIPGSTDQLIDEGQKLLGQSKGMKPEDATSEQAGDRMLKISRKLEASGQRMEQRLSRTADVGDRDTERYLILIDEISDLAADLGFEGRRLLDLDETLDW